MEHNTRTGRLAATATGAIILAASAGAVIVAGRMDLPHAVLTGSLALGVLVGAATIGRAWSQRRIGLALAIGTALLAGEAFNLIATADRIVAEREHSQIAARQANDRHAAAAMQLDAAIGTKEAADKAARTEAAKPGCKENCRKLIEAQVANAAADLEAARKVYSANPKTNVSGSPLADRLGLAPWIIDLAVAGLLSIAANGLAAGLIAYGTHTSGQHAVAGPRKGATAPATDPASPNSPAPSTPPQGRRRGRKADPKVASFIEAFETRHGRRPSGNELRAQFPQMPSSTRYRHLRVA